MHINSSLSCQILEVKILIATDWIFARALCWTS